MDRKRYMKEVYSKVWITARENKYGFLKYDKNLCNYICEHIPNAGKLLGVAIGTGYPFEDFFQKAGYLVCGIDISPDLIKKCWQLNQNINCKVGDAEDLDYPDNFFDCTYCFHSTWYFPNLNKVIDEMIRVTCPGGFVIFDIQNRNNKDINRYFQKTVTECTKIHGKMMCQFKNVIKMLLRKGNVNWHYVIYEVPTYPESIYEHLKDRQITNFQVMVKLEDQSIETRNEPGSFLSFPRLVFVVYK